MHKAIRFCAALVAALTLNVLISSFQTAFAQTCTPARPDLVSWYAADGNALDSRSRKNGTLTGTTFVAGQNGQGIRFAAPPATDSLSADGSGALDITGDKLTIEAWIKLENNNVAPAQNFTGAIGKFLFPTEPFALFFEGGLIGNTNPQLAANQWQLEYILTNSTGTRVHNQSTGVIVTVDGNYHHFALTYDGAGSPTNNVKLYIDGILQAATIPIGQSGNLRSAPLESFQIQTGSSGSPFSADEVSVYNRTLSAPEIAAIAAAGTAGKCKPTATVAPSGQVAWFGGDGNPNDISGNANNGTLQNGATFAVGKAGQAFSFDGVDDFVRIPISPSLQTISSAITIDLWAKLNSFNSPASLLLSNHINGFGSPVSGVILFVDPSGTVVFQTRLNNLCCQQVLSNGVLQIGVWHHITGVWDGVNLRLYIDGTLDNSVPASGTLQMNRDIFLGINADSFFGGTIDHQVNGLIDEVSLYNRALTQAEITSIFNAGIAGKLKTATTAPGSNVSTNAGSDATITFPNVTTAGTTQQIPLDPAALPPVPSGYSLVGLNYDLATAATVSGPINICFNLPSITNATVFSHLKVLHAEAGMLVDRTTGQNFGSRTLCGSVPSLSPFAIAQNPSLPTAAPATISGRVTTPDGSPLAGVTMNLSGARSTRTITDANGNYRFTNVDTDNFYTVAPSLVNHHFNPPAQSFSLLGNKTDATFTATRDGVITGNAIDTSGFFVRQHYLDFLGREPDESGFNFWSDQIGSCGSDAGCLERKTINVSAAYFLSIEFQQTGGLVDGLYRASYGRRPLYAEFTPDAQTVARNVVVGTADWAQTLEANKQAFIAAWVQRADFRAAYDGLTNAAYIDRLIANTRVTLSAAERDALLTGLNSGATTRSVALRRITEDERFVNAKRNEMFVMMEYFGYLRRDPDDSGYQFWLNKLNQFGGNFEQAEMVKAFINSGEYRNRFR